MSLQNDSNTPRCKIDATRVIASAVGVLCGISGLEHAFFEILQGNVAPDGILSSAIGPAHRFWSGGTLHALTIIPNYLLTGILATLFSLMVIIWSVGFIHRKRGASIFLILSVLQFLAGGGFGQIFLVLVTASAATRIDAPLHWWRAHLPQGVRGFLAKIWLWLLIGFVLSFSAAMFAGIFGYLPALSGLFDLTSEKLPGFLYILGYTTLGLLLLAFLAGFSHDIEKRVDHERNKDEHIPPASSTKSEFDLQALTDGGSEAFLPSSIKKAWYLPKWERTASPEGETRFSVSLEHLEKTWFLRFFHNF